MAKPTDEIEDISQVEVKLKPFLGIQPGLYLTVIYSLAALVLLFLLLFLPGIRKNGTVYTFESVPSGAAVHVDGLYAGSTPVKAFIESGEHEVIVSRPHFETNSKTIRTGGRLFGSLFVPRRVAIRSDLELDDLELFLLSRLGEISEWGLVNQFGPSYQAPNLISATVADYYDAEARDEALLDQFLESVLSSLNGEVFLADYLRALFLRESHGRVPAARSVVRLIRRIAALDTLFPGLALLISATFPSEIAAEYLASDWFDAVVGTYREILGEYAEHEENRTRDERIIAGLPFVLVPPGRFTMGMPIGGAAGAELPHPETTQELYMLKGEVTRRWFSFFLEEHPEWGPARRDELVAAGLVDERYLSDWEEDIDRDVPLAYVSMYAARAFADWFGDNLPVAWQSFAARLPLESEWEWASLLFSTESEIEGYIRSDGPLAIDGKDGVEHLQGSLWEWCNTWFHPADYFVKPWRPVPIEAYGVFDTGAEAVVRGGSWANSEVDRVSPVSRGSQPPEWCTPFTGFRIVLVRK